jgi:O-antigen ligase
VESASAAFGESRPGRWLEYAALTGVMFLLVRLGCEEDLTWLAWVVVGFAVALLTAVRWPYGALVVLIGTSAMPRFFVEVLGWKARPEHFASAIVSSAFVVWLVFHRQRLRLNKPDYWILAYVALNFVSSAFESPEPASTLRWALQNTLAILPYFLIRLMVRDVETLQKAFRILLAVGVAESLYGIACDLSHHVFGTTAGMDFAYLVDVAAPYGSMFEPNLFGAYAGCCAVLLLAVYLNGRHNTTGLLSFFITALAAVASLSRAVLLALLVTVGWLIWKGRRPRSAGRKRSLTFVLTFTVILLVVSVAIGGIVRERFSNLYNQGLADETTITRLVEIQEALQDIPTHPFLGSGTASFQLSFDWGKYIPQWAGNSTWVGNVSIRILHDTGLLGLAAVLGFLVSVWLQIRPSARGWISQAPMLSALLAGTLFYAISFQATDGTTLAFSWVHLGLLASAASLLKNSNPAVSNGAAGGSPAAA